MPKRAIRINGKDNVAVLVESANSQDEVAVSTGWQVEVIIAIEAIPFNFKMALVDIHKGQAVLKYGEVIGEASMEIPKGSLVHRHNLVGRRGRGDLMAREER
jgi:altronate dehydratase